MCQLPFLLAGCIIISRSRKAVDTMKFEVIVKVWSDEQKKQIEVVAGTFDRFMNAKLFADAYANYYHTAYEIVEWVRK